MQRLAREHKKPPEEDEKKKKEEKEKKKEPKLVLPQLAKVELRSYRPGKIVQPSVEAGFNSVSFW